MVGVYALGRDKQFGRAAGAKFAIAVVYNEFDLERSRSFIGDGCDVADRAAYLFTGREQGLGRVTDGNVFRIELGQVGRNDDPAVVHEGRDRIAAFDEITDFYDARLQRTVERCTHNHVLQIELRAGQFGFCCFELGDGFLQLCFRDVAVGFQADAALVFDLALPDGCLGLGEPRFPVAFVETHDQAVTIDVGTAFGTDGDNAAIRFGGQFDDPGRRRLAVDDDRACDFLGTLRAYANAGLRRLHHGHVLRRAGGFVFAGPDLAGEHPKRDQHSGADRVHPGSMFFPQ